MNLSDTADLQEEYACDHQHVQRKSVYVLGSTDTLESGEDIQQCIPPPGTQDKFGYPIKEVVSPLIEGQTPFL